MKVVNHMHVFEKYTEVESLYKKRDALLACDEVIVTEKIDGTNMRIALLDNIFCIGGRNMQFDLMLPQGDMGFVQWCKDNTIEHRLRSLGIDTIIVYGEFCGEKINVPIYGKGRDFLVFDIKIDGRYIDWDRFMDLARKLGLSTPPILYRGKPLLDVFNKFRKSVSVYGKTKAMKEYSHEGIVIRSTQAIYREDGYLIAKYKDPLFEERRSLQEGKDALIKTGYTYAYEFVTSERLKHVISQMQETGCYTDSFECIKDMVTFMIRDSTEKEGKEEFGKLSQKEQHAARKIISKFTQELFQEYLINRKEAS